MRCAARLLETLLVVAAYALPVQVIPRGGKQLAIGPEGRPAPA